MKSVVKSKIKNIFASIGYFFAALEWSWVIILYFNFFQQVITLIAPSRNSITDSIPSSPLVEIPQPTSLIIGTFITLVMFLATLYILYRLPSTVARTGKKITISTAEVVTPFILRRQHKKVSKQARLKLNQQVVLFLKWLLILLPLVLSLLANSITEVPIDYAVAQVISFGLTAFGGLFFIAEFLIIKSSKNSL